MNWHIGESEGERLFWAAQFSAFFEDARVLSQAKILSGDMYPDLSGLDEEWKNLVRARQLLAETEYDAVVFLTSALTKSSHGYVRILAGYYRAWAWWGSGTFLADSIDDLGIDISTQFGRAMAFQMLAWHRRRALDFPGHIKSLQRAVTEFLTCDPLPSYWLARTLVALLHTAFEMADFEAMSLGRQAFHAVDWVEQIEHERFDCLRALSRFSFVSGDIDGAVKYIAKAKSCFVPWTCKAHAFLHSASYALEAGENLWAREQLQIAQELLGSTSRNDSCPEYRTVVLSLALQYSEIDPHKAQCYLEQYHQLQADPGQEHTFDRHLDAIANISLGKIGLALSPGDSYSLEVLERSYQIACEYGFHYRAAVAASEIAGAQNKRKLKEQWIEKSITQINSYGNKSPLRSLLERKLARIHLTSVEQQVCDLVVAGKKNCEIASELFVTEGRVANIVSEVCRKYGVRGRSGLLSRLR